MNAPSTPSAPDSGVDPARPSVRFLHSGDWQLGMMRRFLGPEAQARFGQARLDAIERIGRAAADHDVAFVVVAGDVFDANQVDRQVVMRACEALRSIPCPVYLLPGNHDALEPGSVWTSQTFRHHVPDHVEVLDDRRPRHPCPGVEVVGVPWRTRRPVVDPVLANLELHEPPADTLRILVGHGQVDALAPHIEAPAQVGLAGLEEHLAAGRLHYVALGDRHSRTAVGETGRVWYAGSPEPTRPEEEHPGEILRVELTPDDCAVEPLSIGTWRLLSLVRDIESEADLDALERWLAELPDKPRTAIRLGLRGLLPVSGVVRLELMLDAYAEVFAAIQRSPRHWDIRPRPDDAELDALPLAGPVRGTLDELRAASGAGDTEAADALALLHRIAGAPGGAGSRGAVGGAA